MALTAMLRQIPEQFRAMVALLATFAGVAREEGLETGATCAAATSGAFALAAAGEFDDDDTVVLLNTGAGNKDVDTLRAHIGETAAKSERGD